MMMTKSKSNNNNKRGRRRGKTFELRSGLEDDNRDLLKVSKIDFEYETIRIPYKSVNTYKPDFILLSNGIIVETKGRFFPSDRSKHLKVRTQHPNLDIRFVFTNSKAKLNPKSKTTYGEWCDKKGFKYADKLIPTLWLSEPPNKLSLQSITKLKTGGV